MAVGEQRLVEMRELSASLRGKASVAHQRVTDAADMLRQVEEAADAVDEAMKGQEERLARERKEGPCRGWDNG